MFKSNTSLTSKNNNKPQRTSTSYNKAKKLSNLHLSLSTFRVNKTKSSYNNKNTNNNTSTLNNINTDYTNFQSKKKISYPLIRPYSTKKSPYLRINTLNNKNNILNKK